MKVVVLQPHTYAGVKYKKGATYNCADKFVKALTILNKVAPYVEPEPEPVRPKRQYTRKVVAPEATEPEATKPSASRGRYNRRDMTAEES